MHFWGGEMNGMNRSLSVTVLNPILILEKRRGEDYYGVRLNFWNFKL